jgi:uncharacterized damage-inducible protein DinB
MSLQLQRKFFNTATACFRPQDAGFAPKPEMFTVAAQIAHTAGTVDWFINGVFSPTGFDMDFPAHEAVARSVTSLAEARRRLDASYDAAIARMERTTLADLHVPIAPGPIMGGAPRIAVFEAMADHTAHHRGALGIYARLIGLVPAMPYA